MHNQGKVKQNRLQKLFYFFLTKMVVGIGLIVSAVMLIEWLRSSLLDKANLSDDIKSVIVAIAESVLTTACYIYLFRWYEKRPVEELSGSSFLEYGLMGFLGGILLQSLFIFFIYAGGTYLVNAVNSASVLVKPFAFALTAGFVAEIIIIGIVFRLWELQAGTLVALLTFIVLFALLHINAKGATFISVMATAMNAGLLLLASFIYSRSLWLPVFLHVGWDFAEPGIFGGINPSTSLTQSLLTSKIDGNSLLTGGVSGPQDSLPSMLFCLFLGLMFLVLAKRKGNFIVPKWIASRSINA